MHLRLTEQELATLIEMVSLAANVASWNQKPDADPKLSAYETVEQKLLEKGRLAGLGEIIEWDEERQRLAVSADYQEQSFFQECYDEFRNESFWEELVIRLADKALVRRIGRRAWERLTEEQRREKTAGIEKSLWHEFGERGVNHLAVIHPPGEG
jgi:hypothetical protein